MPLELANRVKERAASVAVTALWAQWGGVSDMLRTRRAWTVIDPEALVLGSLAFAPFELRLADVLGAFARSGKSLLSVTRMRQLMGRYPADVQAGVGAFANVVVASGGRHWATLASGNAGPLERRGKDFGDVRLLRAPTLMLRFRAGFGVNANADVLSFLLGVGRPVNVKMIGEGLGYLGRSVRIAADNLALAGFIERLEGSPVEYRAQVRPWAGVLRLERVEGGVKVDPRLPRWHYWADVFAFFAAVAEWSSAVGGGAGTTDYVASSRARDLVARYMSVVRLVGADFVVGDPVRGTEFLPVFERVVQRAAEWAEAAVFARSFE